MKKLTSLLLSAIFILSLAACGNSNSNNGQNAAGDTEITTSATETASTSEDNTTETTETESSADDTESDNQNTQSENNNILIAYFSVMETDGADTVAGASRVASGEDLLGNNQYIAQLIQQETGGELFQIETVQSYPTTHDALLDFAYEEKAQNARPELSTKIENLDNYDVIFLGYPNWNADLPMPLYTFLEEYDFSNKTIIPFTTHGGSGFSGTVQTISQLQPNANIISEGLSISRDDVSTAESDVVNWVKGLNL